MCMECHDRPFLFFIFACTVHRIGRVMAVNTNLFCCKAALVSSWNWKSLRLTQCQTQNHTPADNYMGTCKLELYIYTWYIYELVVKLVFIISPRFFLLTRACSSHSCLSPTHVCQISGVYMMASNSTVQRVPPQNS